MILCGIQISSIGAINLLNYNAGKNFIPDITIEILHFLDCKRASWKEESGISVVPSKNIAIEHLKILRWTDS